MGCQFFGGSQFFEALFFTLGGGGNLGLASGFGGEFGFADLAGGFALGGALLTGFVDGDTGEAGLLQCRILRGGFEFLQHGLFSCSGSVPAFENVGGTEVAQFTLLGGIR